MTAIKILMIFGLASVNIDASERARAGIISAAKASSTGWKSWSGFGAAVLAALWAFDGWNNLSMAAGEIRNPDRVIPRALTWGVMAVLLLYVGANLAYFYALPFCGSREFELHALSRRIAGCDKGRPAKLRRRRGRDTFHRLRFFRVGRDERNDFDRRPRSLRDGPGRLDVVAARRSECTHAFTRRAARSFKACGRACSPSRAPSTN